MGVICFMSYLVLFRSCVFQSFLALRLPRLGKKELNLSAFRMFVRFALLWFCLFPLPLGVWEGLRFVIVALPGLFSYLFFFFFFFFIKYIQVVLKRFLVCCKDYSVICIKQNKKFQIQIYFIIRYIKINTGAMATV